MDPLTLLALSVAAGGSVAAVLIRIEAFESWGAALALGALTALTLFFGMPV